MIDNLGESKFGEAGWVAAKLIDIAVHSRPIRGNDAIAFVSVMLDPELPTERTDPKAIDENDGSNVHCEKLVVRASRSPGNSRMTGGRKLNTARLLISSGLC